MHAPNTYICRPDDVDAMRRAIEETIERWSKGGVVTSRAQPFVQNFERRRLTNELARVFDVVYERSDHAQRT
jgi:hypothetical protein